MTSSHSIYPDQSAPRSNIKSVDTDAVITIPNIPLWKILVTNFVGSVMFMFISIITSELTFQQGFSSLNHAIAVGLSMLTLGYIFGEYASAYFNPIIAFGLTATGLITWEVMIAYWIVQFIASIVAAALVLYFLGAKSGADASIGSLIYTAPWKALFFEASASFFLVLSVLVVTYKRSLKFVKSAAIGIILCALTLIGGYLTGGSYNPSKSFGQAVFTGTLSTYWIYLVGPFLGAIAAVLVYKLLTYDRVVKYITVQDS
jgi:glycerol uptake facilitator-like aquaporin